MAQACTTKSRYCILFTFSVIFDDATINVCLIYYTKTESNENPKNTKKKIIQSFCVPKICRVASDRDIVRPNNVNEIDFGCHTRDAYAHARGLPLNSK